MRKRGGRSRDSKATQSLQPEAPEEVTLQLIAQKLDRLTWRHRLWGVDERQAWHVIQRLDQMYRQLYREQQLRYEALLAEARGRRGSQATSRIFSPDPPRHG